MNANYLKNQVGSLLLGVTLVSGIAMATVTAAQAQDRGNRDRQVRVSPDRNWDRGQSRDRNRVGETRRFPVQNDRYRDWDRNRDRYRYRNDRYRSYPNSRVRVIQTPRYGTYDNYGGYGNYGNYGNYGYGNNNYEQSQGFQDGLYTGSNDARRGQSYNPYRSHFYKDARSGLYRNSFLRGYQQGFQSYGGYGRR